MKIAFLVLTAAVVPEPVVLDAQAQMELAHYVAAVQAERDKAEEKAVYWYNRWKDKKGVCI